MEYETGKVMKHVLGKMVSVIKVCKHTRNKNEEVKTIKCRYMDENGIFHIYEFFPEELIEVWV